MEENINKETDPVPSSKNFWQRNKRLILMAAAAVIFLVLLVFGNDFFNSKRIFTQYDGISQDSIIRRVDSTASDPDETVMTDATEGDYNEAKPDEPADTTSSGIFSVNTTYDKIVETAVPNKQITVDPEGLFEKLLMPEEKDQEFENFYNTYRNQNILSSESILKLLAITGRSILLEHNDADDQLLMQVLTESEKVNGIIIVDDGGKVIYATNRKYLNTLLVTTIPEIDLTKLKISWYQKGDENIVAIPVFHTYGKIGTAILITQI